MEAKYDGQSKQEAKNGGVVYILCFGIKKYSCYLKYHTFQIQRYESSERQKTIFHYISSFVFEHTLQRRYNAGDGSHKIEPRYK